MMLIISIYYSYSIYSVSISTPIIYLVSITTIYTDSVNISLFVCFYWFVTLFYLVGFRVMLQYFGESCCFVNIGWLFVIVLVFSWLDFIFIWGENLYGSYFMCFGVRLIVGLFGLYGVIVGCIRVRL